MRLGLRQSTPVGHGRRSALLVVLAASLALVAFASAGARAAATPDFVVIANSQNPIREVSVDFVAEALLKKTTRWGNGATIRPVDLAVSSAVRRRFTEHVLKRSVAAVRSYWQQRIFTGRGVPPAELDSDEAVVRYVNKYPGAIGYVGPGTKLADGKVVALRIR